jgi:hypothetical protein
MYYLLFWEFLPEFDQYVATYASLILLLLFPVSLLCTDS